MGSDLFMNPPEMYCKQCNQLSRDNGFDICNDCQHKAKLRILQKVGMAVEKAEKTPTTLAELTRELKRILDQ